MMLAKNTMLVNDL